MCLVDVVILKCCVMCILLQGEVWICMELMDISLEQFYKRVHTVHGRFDEDILSVIAFSVCVKFLLSSSAVVVVGTKLKVKTQNYVTY